MNNPNHEGKDSLNKYLFPLHRIKSIMKQDSFYTPKAEAVASMSKATEIFGEYLLEEIKKTA
jgi:hypothetical protein